MAFLSDECLREILATHGLPSLAENTITDRNELLAELAEIRETGVAFSAEESSNGMRSVASPIFDPDNEVIGSICVS